MKETPSFTSFPPDHIFAGLICNASDCSLWNTLPNLWDPWMPPECPHWPAWWDTWTRRSLPQKITDKCSIGLWSPTKLGCALCVELPVPLVGEDAGLAETRVDPALLGQHSGDKEQEQRHHPLHDGLSSAFLPMTVSWCLYSKMYLQNLPTVQLSYQGVAPDCSGAGGCGSRLLLLPLQCCCAVVSPVWVEQTGLVM